ncbi:MAG: DUF2200 domain-containing protein [Micrococcales bacterium]
MHRIFQMEFGTVYPLNVKKVERKGHTVQELDQVIEWLTGFTPEQVQRHIDARSTFTQFFAAAQINPNAELITGTICGVKVQDIDDPLMQQIRYLDKLVDEVANGRPMHKILRAA